MRRLRIAVGLSMMLVSCGSAPPIEGRARRELRCPTVSLSRTGAGGWSAHGCGRTATFVCAGDTCVLERSSASTERAAEEQPAIELAAHRCIAIANHPNRALTACDLMRSVETQLLECRDTRVIVAYDQDGRPESVGDGTACVTGVLSRMRSEPELANVVVRLQRRP
ncbi:MAG: hypothetical protein J0L92_24180 [Deltaproteobacteria bacterium]|nr:hypothetical protein [Deltaproteobacteria bacterium]